uniref:Uncharacterized protein n=2 Tax=Lutzomyia longipalpis TaxID=7200 RepID=A0A1B0CFA5_LUTLO
MDFMDEDMDEEDTMEDSDSDYEPILNWSLFHDRDSGIRGSAATRRSYILLVLQNLVGSGLIEYEGNELARKLPKIQGKQTTDSLMQNDFYRSVLAATGGNTNPQRPWNVAQMLNQRQNLSPWTAAQKCRVNNLYVPKIKERVAMKCDSKVFCGSFTPNGKYFVTACQDGEISVYDATTCAYRRVNTLMGRDVEWSILDMDFSPDGQEFVYATRSCCPTGGNTNPQRPWNVAQMLNQRQNLSPWTAAQKCRVNNLYVPKIKERVAMKCDSKVFCGSFTPNGKYFVTACQDGEISVYDATTCAYRRVNTLMGRDVEWSILDMDFSPDGQEFVYATRSCCLHVGNLLGRSAEITCIPFDEFSVHKFASYSVQFASGGHEIVAGCSDGAVSVFDREKSTWTERAFEDNMEVNAVRLLEDNSHIVCAGSDDGAIRIYDRRSMATKSRGSMGMFVGHLDGVTSIDVKNDGRYYITNSKDQNDKVVGCTVNELAGDTSVMSYRGHRVFKSLIRAKFSPARTTGQRYIYTGCGTGYLVMYDVLTGEMVQAIRGHSNIVRDVAWHPSRSEILTSSWDHNVNLYSYKAEGWKREAKTGVTLRRSLRIANRNRRLRSESS